MSVLRVKNGDQWDIVPAIKGDTGDPAADESITDAMLVPDGIKTEIDWLWGNQLMDIREGELLQTDDAYEAPLVSLDVDGNSTQVTTTGKNLFSDATDTWTNYTIVQGAYKYVEIDVPPSTQLVVSPTSTAAISGVSGFNGYVVLWFDTTSFQNDHIAYPINAGKPMNRIFTSGANGKLRVGLASTMTQEALDALWAKVKLQLEVGSSATAYEPYTGGKPSPNPDYPQEIASVEQPALTFVGKNLLDLIPQSVTLLSANVPIVVTDESITINGTSSANGGGRSMHLSEVVTLSAGQYVIDAESIPSNVSCFIERNSDNTILGRTDAEALKTFTISEATDVYFGINLLPNATYSNQVIRRPQLEAGSTATDYEPYLGHTVPLLPDGYSLRSIPNGTKDELHLSYLRPSTREGWAWYDRELVKRCDTHTFNGSETWTGGTIEAYNGATGTNRFNNQITNLRRATQVPMRDCLLSDSLMHTSTNIWSTPDNYIWYTVANDNQIHIVFDNATIGVTEETAQAERTTAIRTWLAENPITIYYPLATPVTTQLDPIELPIMPSKDTTIWSDPSAQLKMTYIQDTNLVIESLEAAVADMATS